MPKKKVIPSTATNLLGERGEKIAFLALTDYSVFPKPLFQLAFLGDKWPSADFYAELLQIRGHQPAVLFQVKTSARGLRKGSKSLGVQLSKRDVGRLDRIPLPAYVLGVCEHSKQVFARIVEKKRIKGIATISTKNKLTPAKLKLMHAEIAAWWKDSKNTKSKFI